MFLSRFFDYYPRDIESVMNVTLTSGHRMFMLMMIVLGSTLVLVFNKKIKNWKYEDLTLKIMGVILILMGAYRYEDVAGWGFATVGIGFFCIAWVFNALKGRV